MHSQHTVLAVTARFSLHARLKHLCVVSTRTKLVPLDYWLGKLSPHGDPPGDPVGTSPGMNLADSQHLTLLSALPPLWVCAPKTDMDWGKGESSE